jgi:hypothetical protein
MVSKRIRKLTLGLSILLTAAACKDLASGLTLVTGAPSAARSAGTAKTRFEIAMTTSGLGQGVPEFTFTFGGDGAIDFKSQTGRMALKGAPTGGLSTTLGTETIFSKSNVYTKSPECPSGALDGKPWIKVDASEFTGFEPASAGASDPTNTLDTLAGAGKATEVGEERVIDVETTHYRAEIDKKKALDALPAERREKAEAALAQISAKQFDADVWISDDRLPRKISMTLDGQTPAGSPFKMATTNEFFDYGDPVKITVPSDTEAFVAQNYEAVLQATIKCNPSP